MRKLFIIAVLIQFNFSLYSQTVHLILVSDTEDNSIGKGCAVNHEALKITFQNIVVATKYDLSIIEIHGGSFNHIILQQQINNLDVKNTDVVFFYYSGHGKNSVINSWPQLLIGGNIYLDGIHETLVSKNAKLTLTVGDCCNFVTGEKFQPIASKSIYKPETCENIFSISNKNILVCSSSQGELAYYSPSIGGLYTASFVNAISEELSIENKNISWEAVFEKTKILVNELADGINQQTPQIRIGGATELIPIFYEYKVKSGNTLYSLSKKYDVTINEIKQWNNLKSDTIITGSILKIKKNK